MPGNYPKLYDMLSDKKVQMDFNDNNSNSWVSILVNASPFLLLIGFWIFMMRQMQSGGNKALSFGKSRARLHSTQQRKVTFKDVAGVEEAKEELQEIIEFLREPAEVSETGRTHSQRRAADRTSGNRQDPAGPGDRRRSQRAVLLHLRFGLRRNVRRRGREPRARSVRAGQKERALHHLHRRNRRGRAVIAARASAADTTSASRR